MPAPPIVCVHSALHNATLTPLLVPLCVCVCVCVLLLLQVEAYRNGEELPREVR